MVDMCITFIQHQRARCRLCHAPAPPDLPLCERCLAALPHLENACPSCALPMEVGAPPESLCGECQADPPAFERSRVPLRYQAPVSDLISRFKYHRALSDGQLLAQLLARHVRDTPLDVQLLLPMPLHPGRLKERGYNQAAELARTLSRATGIPWNSTLLKRKRAAPTQREANKRERRRNVRKAFVCESKNLPQRVAIIDDVVTTGSTARAAAAAVKLAGADRVEIWAVARTPKPGD